jgi:hypothetical protein
VAISLIQAKTASGTSTSGSISFTSTGAGNLLVAIVCVSNSNGSTNPTFTTPANWTAEGSPNLINVYSPQAGQLYYYPNNPGGLTSATLAFSAITAGGGWSALFLEFSGIATTSPIDVEGQFIPTAYATTLSESITTTVNGDLVIGFAYTDTAQAGGVITAEPSGWTTITGVPVNDAGGAGSLGAAWQVQTSAGNITYAPTSGASQSYFDWVVSFKAASGGTSVNGSANILALAGILGGISGIAALPRGINAGPGIGGGINATASFGGGINAQGEIQASSAATPTETFEGQAGINSGLSGQGEVGASSAATPQETVQGSGSVDTGQAASGNLGTGYSGNSGLFSGLSGLSGFISGLAGQGIIPAVTGTLGGLVHAIATILAEAGFLGGMGGQGMVYGSTTSLNQATVTGSGNVSPNFLAGIGQIIASSVAAVYGTILSGAGLGTGQSSSGSVQAVSAATPRLTATGSGTLAGGLIAGISDILANGRLLRFFPFRLSFSVKSLLNLIFGQKPRLSLTFSEKPKLSLNFAETSKLSLAFTHLGRINLTFFLEPPVAKPNSTITVTSTATDINGNPVSNMATVTVIVTFPDNSTQNFSLSSGVTNAGSGNYTVTYTTKGVGQCLEDWVMIDSTGNQTEAHNITPVGF